MTARNGKIYLSIPAAARVLGTTTTKLKEIAISEGLEFENFRTNGKLWISEESVSAFLARSGSALHLSPKSPKVRQVRGAVYSSPAVAQIPDQKKPKD